MLPEGRCLLLLPGLAALADADLQALGGIGGDLGEFPASPLVAGGLQGHLIPVPAATVVIGPAVFQAGSGGFFYLIFVGMVGSLRQGGLDLYVLFPADHAGADPLALGGGGGLLPPDPLAPGVLRAGDYGGLGFLCGFGFLHSLFCHLFCGLFRGFLGGLGLQGHLRFFQLVLPVFFTAGKAQKQDKRQQGANHPFHWNTSFSFSAE